MGSWYRVVKTIKGNQYIYEQQTYREGGRVRTRNRYLGPAGAVGTGSRGYGGSLEQSAGNFGRAMVGQTNALRRSVDADEQFGRVSEPSNLRVTTTPLSRAPPGLPNSHASGARHQGNAPRRDVQAEITNTIIKAIETGQDTGTFQMPWHAVASTGLPVNGVTHQAYHGVNVLLLSFIAQENHWPNRWASFQQWKEKGASVKRGEHGVPIVFYTSYEIEETEHDENGSEVKVVKKVPVLRHSIVFNITQVDNPPPVTTTTTPVKPIETAEQFISSTKADIRYGGNSASYTPSEDYIRMPERVAFIGSKTSSPTETFYATILHELCHWTGNTKRLNRNIANRFGDEGYAAEELVAEIGAAIVCAELGISPELRADHIQYVSSWLKILKGDKRAIFTAAAAASRAVEYLEKLQV